MAPGTGLTVLLVETVRPQRVLLTEVTRLEYVDAVATPSHEESRSGRAGGYSHDLSVQALPRCSKFILFKMTRRHSPGLRTAADPRECCVRDRRHLREEFCLLFASVLSLCAH